MAGSVERFCIHSGFGGIGSISGNLGDVTAGTSPQPQGLPHFEVAERTEKGRLMAMNDPTELLAHAAWHRAAAKMVAPETDKGVLEQLDKRYSIVRQDVPTQAVLALDDAWLFCAPDLSPADAGFIAVAATTGGLAAVEKWGERSPLAAALVPAVAEEPHCATRCDGRGIFAAETVGSSHGRHWWW